MKTDNDEIRAKINGKGRLRVAYNKHGERTFRRKVLTNGSLAGERLADELGITTDMMRKIAQGFVRILRSGYEIRFGGDSANCVHIYPCLEKDMKTMFVAAQVIGEKFRGAITDLSFSYVRNGGEVNEQFVADELEQLKRERGNQKRVAVTPDMMVTCPKCGVEFRVGRAIANQ